MNGLDNSLNEGFLNALGNKFRARTWIMRFTNHMQLSYIVCEDHYNICHVDRLITASITWTKNIMLKSWECDFLGVKSNRSIILLYVKKPHCPEGVFGWRCITVDAWYVTYGLLTQPIFFAYYMNEVYSIYQWLLACYNCWTLNSFWSLRLRIAMDRGSYELSQGLNVCSSRLYNIPIQITHTATGCVYSYRICLFTLPTAI
jgi:hypothetical protein